MTIREIRAKTDWQKTLQSRSVFAVIEGEQHPLRIVSVGIKHVHVLRNGQRQIIDPRNIASIQGLS